MEKFKIFQKIIILENENSSSKSNDYLSEDLWDATFGFTLPHVKKSKLMTPLSGKV